MAHAAGLRRLLPSNAEAARALREIGLFLEMDGDEVKPISRSFNPGVALIGFGFP